jgi:hypothetical protein
MFVLEMMFLCVNLFMLLQVLGTLERLFADLQNEMSGTALCKGGSWDALHRREA